jgi:hypothetical protein
MLRLPLFSNYKEIRNHFKELDPKPAMSDRRKLIKTYLNEWYEKALSEGLSKRQFCSRYGFHYGLLRELNMKIGTLHLYAKLGDGRSKNFAKIKNKEWHQRRIEIMQLRSEGWTLQAIATKHGVSRQRIFSILQKSTSEYKKVASQ